ncbi:MAG: NAD-dependent deacylase [Chloroflexi bacterium]|nr:NAD-dependent deacylase [Ardenticatenaceae bacterium]MBL1130225.1 NAD-dependent deacylase [Chloroflexota bacterium]NOG36316.1 NAD-dependent deacylase [Chloroflexota bacterium]GIK58352.1 MAG: NAD-dependent deacetylase [Chloroflexota bacterium]
MSELDSLLHKAIALVQKAHTIVALTGAGISTPSGIPDFRSPHSGLWEQANPMEVASIYGFKHDPRPFYQWLYPLAQTVLNAQPNAAHLALAHMEQAGALSCVVTQNIDLLHQKAGSQTVYEVHGHMRDFTCMDCNQIVHADLVTPRFLETGDVPLCLSCGGVLKPNVVLFGEVLPLRVLQQAQYETAVCDLMLVAGSSLEVSPVNELPWQAKRQGSRLIIVNLDETHLDHVADVVIHADVVEILPQLAAAVKARD